jgi:hypothetical protein
VPFYEAKHVALLNITRTTHLKSETFTNFGQERIVPPWVDLLLEKETETAGLINLMHV